MISRCVRRAFLCGYDRLTERRFDHRKGWVVEKLAELAAICAIHVRAYAVVRLASGTIEPGAHRSHLASIRGQGSRAARRQPLRRYRRPRTG